MEDSKWANPQYEANQASTSSYAQPSDYLSTSVDPMDEFAQTRAPDDLFADDFTPISDPLPEPRPPPHPQRQHHTNTPRGPRGRGRGRGGTQNITTINTPRAPATAPTTTQDATTPAITNTSDPAPAPATSSPTSPTKPPTAVRGDRTATGGLSKPKLTDAELTERMAAIKLKNASLEAAHARASADEASFQAREALATERRRVERQNRQQLMGERERNRLRKLQAVGGREWDAAKDGEEEREREGRGSGVRRGAFGGVVGGVVGQPGGEGGAVGADAEVEEAFMGRGGYGVRGRGERGARGARGGRGGPGRGRGAFDGSHRPAQKTVMQAVPAASDFPELPPVAKKEASGPVKIEGVDAGSAKSTKGPSWAEEMDDAPLTPVNA